MGHNPFSLFTGKFFLSLEYMFFLRALCGYGFKS